MASNNPWSVKGVDPETREAAKIAARRAGMTVSQWISLTIRTAATEQLSSTVRPDGGPAMPGERARAPSPTPPTGAARPPAPTMDALFENIQKLSNRLEQAEMKTAATIGPHTEQVEQLAQRIDQSRSEYAVSTAPVERAVTRLAERLEKIENHEKPRRGERSWRLFGN